jgi:hypothetical protein
LSVVSGVASALYGYYTFIRSIVPSLVAQIVATIGSLLYLYTTTVAAYFIAAVLISRSGLGIADELVIVLRIGLTGSILLAFVLGVFANINYVGLHRYYRDRLMEAFMPTDSSVSAMQTALSPVADRLSIVELRDSQTYDPKTPAVAPRPYPLINCNVILINDPDRRVGARGGANFLISPLFVGSSTTGWQESSKYIEQNGPFTLSPAMAASGAAANASAGYIGTGITINPLVSAVMSLLNIRPGLWVGNPFHQERRRIRSIPTFLNPGLLAGIFGRAYTYDTTFVELTDGGHFENLGALRIGPPQACHHPGCRW